MSLRYAALLVGVGVVSGGVMFAILSPMAANAEVDMAQRCLRDEMGFMQMDLEELNDYLHHNVTYQYDSEIESFKAPSCFVADKGGDCEDYVLFALAVLDHERYELMPCSGAYNGQGHMFLLVSEGDDRYLVDTAGVNLLADGELPASYTISQTYDDMFEVMA